MCVDIHDLYLDCEKGHRIETYYHCRKALEYLLNINNDGCSSGARTIYCTMPGTCPRCEHGSDCFDNSSETAMDISDDDFWAPEVETPETNET